MDKNKERLTDEQVQQMMFETLTKHINDPNMLFETLKKMQSEFKALRSERDEAIKLTSELEGKYATLETDNANIKKLFHDRWESEDLSGGENFAKTPEEKDKESLNSFFEKYGAKEEEK